jgi:hypothetical protein
MRIFILHNHNDEPVAVRLSESAVLTAVLDWARRRILADSEYKDTKPHLINTIFNLDDDVEVRIETFVYDVIDITLLDTDDPYPFEDLSFPSEISG